MAQLITEVYVSIDGLEYTKLNLHKDEKILMKNTAKDLQDISKIFSPFSLSFTFPADSKNRRAFGFFGDTDVIKINPDNVFKTKIYIESNLTFKGSLKLTDIAYKNNKPTDFTGEFATTMTNLKDRIGEDSIQDLASTSVLIDWTPKEVFQRVKGVKNIEVDGVTVPYFTPLISTNRVWSFDQNNETDLKDNIAYDSEASNNSNNTIKASELRPCITFSSIIELIKNKYNLDVLCPLDLRKEYSELNVWCNAESITSNDFSLVTVKNQLGGLTHTDSKNESGIPDPKKYTRVTNVPANSFKIIKRTSPFSNENNYKEGGFNFLVNFEDATITGESDNISATVNIVRKGDNVIMSSHTATAEETSTNVYDFNTTNFINDSYFTNDSVEFYVYVKFNQPTLWANCKFQVRFKYYDGKTGIFNTKEYATYLYTSSINNNYAEVGGAKIDLIKSLPDVKVIDFLSSYFKSFNMSVYDASPNDDKLYWLTPFDVNTSGLVYSKKEVDYTNYVDISSHKKTDPSEYNYYNFKHADSDYFSNVEYKNAFSLEYGQVKYPDEKPDNDITFDVETVFTIIPPVRLVGSNVYTAYGFTNDEPTLLDTGESRYTPNYDELVVFYNNGNTVINEPLGFQTTNSANAFYNAQLTSYIKVMPFNRDGDSFAFSTLKIDNIEYPNNLFSKYYANQISRLLDPNVLSQEFKLKLPSSEIYLNESTSGQGSGTTPSGFRLQNDVIIMENKFTIVDSEIDYTTGDTTLTLLNY